MSDGDLLNDNFVAWMDSREASESDIVISSRIRLARNLQYITFPYFMNAESGNKAMQDIKDAWENSDSELLSGMDLITFDQTSSLDRQILVEKHLISPEHGLSEEAYRGLLVSKDGSIAIMINEEDHLRIQCLLPGLQMGKCFELAQEIDDKLEKSLDFAFDEHRGYLTSCPTNVGTGMRASVMLHLPGIAISGQRTRIFQNINQLGMTVRGLYGEGTEIVGNYVQLSNQITLGQTENEIITNLGIISRQIVEQEKMLRKSLQEEMKYQLEDRVGRAYGILTNARVMSSNEALALLSDVRLGVDLGIIKGISPFIINQLVVAIKPAHLQRRSGGEMEAFIRDVKRAEVIKEILLKSRQ
ncbi:putative atp:guanido phosphotransferase yaci [hydrocarbon metagenome]|uniref:Putative atp:guanido phosphotransferase yaci n=1 Tax=hydrocarbon metagenome TaxID=938273 RepID=A0A0W8E9T5_9ZZZZ